MTIREIKNKYPMMKVFSFMFYGQPGVRDMEILEMGIAEAIRNEIFSSPLYILAEEINEEEARAYDVNRGWLIRFVFPKPKGYTRMKGQYSNHDDDWWKEFLSDGLTELRVEHKFLFVETIGDEDV